MNEAQSNSPRDDFARKPEMPETGVAPASSSYWLTRFIFLRFVGFIYFIGFLVLARQMLPLIGSKGLLPAGLYLERVRSVLGPGFDSFLKVPTIFRFGWSDQTLQLFAWIGLLASAVVMLGFANVPILFLLWLLYFSFVEIGQLFWSFGWETLLLETGFLAIFLCPLLRVNPFPKSTPPPTIVFLLLRWLSFRVMFGAGMIKLRGDPCWRDLTCLIYHYETQPMPNPLSWYLHQCPAWFHEAGVLWNHFVELVVPWMMFGPRRVRHLAGVLTISFQAILILSGNLSWLNWLTIAVGLSCFDDTFWKWVCPRKICERATALALESKPRLGQRIAVYVLTAVVAVLSIHPALNLFSSRQMMNASFDPFRLVNTYGAFGSVGKTRYEIIVEGACDAVVGPRTEWREYEFKGKPGDPRHRPPVVAPYHYRLDWQIWFAAMSDYAHNPWLVHFIYKLLQGDRGALSLLANNPFPDAPPRFIRAELYEYHFTTWKDPGDLWWTRKRVGLWLSPLALNNPGLLRFLEDNEWSE